MGPRVAVYAYGTSYTRGEYARRVMRSPAVARVHTIPGIANTYVYDVLVLVTLSRVHPAVFAD